MLRGFRDSAPVRLSDIDPSISVGSARLGDVRAYEVISHERYAFFIDVRKRAREVGISKVWHTGGTNFARSDNGSKLIRVSRVADLGRLRPD